MPGRKLISRLTTIHSLDLIEKDRNLLNNHFFSLKIRIH